MAGSFEERFGKEKNNMGRSDRGASVGRQKQMKVTKYIIISIKRKPGKIE